MMRSGMRKDFYLTEGCVYAIAGIPAVVFLGLAVRWMFCPGIGMTVCCLIGFAVFLGAALLSGLALEELNSPENSSVELLREKTYRITAVTKDNEGILVVLEGGRILAFPLPGNEEQYGKFQKALFLKVTESEVTSTCWHIFRKEWNGKGKKERTYEMIGRFGQKQGKLFL